MGGMASGSKVGITVAVMCATLMAFLDISIVNVAITDIRASYGAQLDQISWVSTGYMMANVIIIPMTGFLQRRFGYRRYFTASIIMFTVASVLCGLAWSLSALILFRILQGVGGGAVIPTAQAVLLARYPREEHGMAGGLFGLAAVTGPLLGPTVGGYLIQISSWHWVFLINLPVGLLAATLSWKYIRESSDEPPKERIDTVGISLLAVGMATLQYVLEEGHREGWDSTQIVIISTVAGIVLVTFVVHELETENPVVDLRVFSNRSYSAGTGINFLIGVAIFSGAYLFSLYCGVVMRYSAMDTGLVFLTAGVVQIIGMPLIGKFSNRFDGRYLMALGITLICISLWMNGHLTTQASFWDLSKPQMVRAAGNAFVFIPLTVAALSDLPEDKRGNATGLFNLTRELGGSIGTAWMGTTIEKSSNVYASQLGESVSLYNPIGQEQLALLERGVTASLPNASGSALKLLDMKVKLQALVKAFNEGFLSVTLVFVMGLFLVLLLKKSKPGAKVDGAH